MQDVYGESNKTLSSDIYIGITKRRNILCS